MRIAGSTKAKNGVQGKVQRIVQGLYLLMLVCLVLSTISCNEENWELINPGATGNTILVRWINAVPNSQPLTLTLNETTSTAATAAGVIAKTIAAPADSTFLAISENQTQKLRYNGRYKFVRNSVETIIGVSGAAATAKEQQLDTIISLTTIRGQNTKSTSAFLRTVVVANDSPAVYSVQQGCPNGKVIGSEMRFKQSTEYVELQPGTFVFSLMRSGFLENVFETTTLTAQKYYTLVISGTKTARAVQLIDEFDTTANAVTIPRTIDAANRTAFIRTVNISRTNVGKVVVSGTQTVAQSLSARAVSAYTTVVACESSTPITSNSITAQCR